jgi:ABC-type transport system substrate-binding protein
MSSYVNETVDELLEQGKTVPGCSVEDRTPIYWEMQRITQEEVAYDFTVNPNQVNILSARLQTGEPGPWDPWDLQNIHNWTISGFGE